MARSVAACGGDRFAFRSAMAPNLINVFVISAESLSREDCPSSPSIRTYGSFPFGDSVSVPACVVYGRLEKRRRASSLMTKGDQVYAPGSFRSRKSVRFGALEAMTCC